jgi:hypothetical protein
MTKLSVECRDCPDCGAPAGFYHTDDCVGETCPLCGLDSFNCGCWDQGSYSVKDLPLNRRIPWNGNLHAAEECIRLGLWCILVSGRGWVPTTADNLAGWPDLNRLYRDYDWNPETYHWEPRNGTVAVRPLSGQGS